MRVSLKLVQLQCESSGSLESLVSPPAVFKLQRSLPLQRAVGTLLIILSPPLLNDGFGLLQAVEPVLLKALLAQLAVERFS
jgi:hypothetical protein